MDNKKTWIWVGLGVLGLATLATATPWIANFHNHLWSDDPAHWGQFGDYIGGTLATILAALSFGGLMLNVIQQNQAMRKEWQLRDDESYNRQAINCLERAFNNVYREKNERFPVRDRQAWIDCARLLLSANELSSRIESDGFKAMYASEREYWRVRFRNLFAYSDNLTNFRPVSYFEKDEHNEALEHNSVYVIYKFMTWKAGQPDRLAAINYKWKLVEISAQYVGAKEYLKQFHMSREEREKANRDDSSSL
ncbi:hypothetical protein FQZ97_545950 [compost metagenome]